MFSSTQISKPVEQEQEEEVAETEKPALPTAHYGQEEEVELTNWEEIFRTHIQETKRLEKENEERIERAEK